MVVGVRRRDWRILGVARGIWDGRKRFIDVFVVTLRGKIVNNVHVDVVHQARKTPVLAVYLPFAKSRRKVN